MSLDSQALTAAFKKYPVVIVSGVISIALLLALYFRSDYLATQEAELKKYSEESDRYRANIANSAQLQDQLNFLISANKAVRERAFNTDSLPQSLQYFYRLETEVGVKYKDLRPIGRADPVMKKGDAPVYLPLSYSITVQGSFVQIITYIKRLEQGIYFCRINSATVSGSEGGVSLNLNLDLLRAP